MSRNNVFKLSGNMALGGGDNYPSNDFDNIKSSLKLLKSKQSQKRSDPPYEPTVNPHTFRICTEVHIPPAQTSASPRPPKVSPVTYRSPLSGLQ